MWALHQFWIALKLEWSICDQETTIGMVSHIDLHNSYIN